MVIAEDSPMKPTAKYADECLDIVQLQNAKAVITPLTEQKIYTTRRQHVIKFNTHCSELLLENCSTLLE